MPELVSDDEGDDLPIPTFQSDEEWRHAILNFKGTRLAASHVSPEC